MQTNARGIAEMTAAMMISGTIGLFVVLSEQPVTAVVFWRCAFGAATLLLVCAAMGLLSRDRISKRQILLAAAGGAAIVINWLLLFAAFSRASISIATAVYNTQPFILLAMGALFLSERLTIAKLAWIVVAFGGMIAIVQAKPGGAYAGEDYLFGILLAFGAAFFYALAALAAKKLKGVPPHLIALIQVSVGIVMLAPTMDFGALPGTLFGWAMLAILGVIHTGVMYILLYGAIQRLPTSLIASLSFIYPIVAILVDLIAFGHRLQPLQIAGAGAILLAVAGSTLGWSLRFPSGHKKAESARAH